MNNRVQINMTAEVQRTAPHQFINREGELDGENRETQTREAQRATLQCGKRVLIISTRGGDRPQANLAMAWGVAAFSFVDCRNSNVL
jgi:hypothetical protein